MSYAKNLEHQLKMGADVLDRTHKERCQQLIVLGEQRKKQFNLQVDQEVKQQETMLTQQRNDQLMMLQQRAHVKRTELENQASALTLEYQKKRTEEEYLVQQSAIERMNFESQRKIVGEMHRLGMHGVPGPAPHTPPISYVPAHMAASTPQASFVPSPVASYVPAPVALPGSPTRMLPAGLPGATTMVPLSPSFAGRAF